ncbi:hypothetical protein MIR68_005262 [Amoeboaphelidium protococcarum]|nr:hypothetical protein MIR68_005262 [Amoeboaphelidium protococcarum]
MVTLVEEVHSESDINETKIEIDDNTGESDLSSVNQPLHIADNGDDQKLSMRKRKLVFDMLRDEKELRILPVDASSLEQQSDLISRLQQFLPQIEQANKRLNASNISDIVDSQLELVGDSDETPDHNDEASDTEDGDHETASESGSEQSDSSSGSVAIDVNIGMSILDMLLEQVRDQ